MLSLQETCVRLSYEYAVDRVPVRNGALRQILLVQAGQMAWDCQSDRLLAQSFGHKAAGSCKSQHALAPNASFINEFETLKIGYELDGNSLVADQPDAAAFSLPSIEGDGLHSILLGACKLFARIEYDRVLTERNHGSTFFEAAMHSSLNRFSEAWFKLQNGIGALVA
jgi:hypothetical protein